MKRYIWTLISTVGFLLAFLFAFGSPATTIARAAALAPQERRVQAEELHHAEDKLREAREILEHAPGEYGGHRKRAIGRIDEAIGEIHASYEDRSR
jgi:predicted metal-dependent hydrolase